LKYNLIFVHINLFIIQLPEYNSGP